MLGQEQGVEGAGKPLAGDYIDALVRGDRAGIEELLGADKEIGLEDVLAGPNYNDVRETIGVSSLALLDSQFRLARDVPGREKILVEIIMGSVIHFAGKGSLAELNRILELVEHLKKYVENEKFLTMACSALSVAAKRENFGIMDRLWEWAGDSGMRNKILAFKDNMVARHVAQDNGVKALKRLFAYMVHGDQTEAAVKAIRGFGEEATATIKQVESYNEPRSEFRKDVESLRAYFSKDKDSASADAGHTASSSSSASSSSAVLLDQVDSPSPSASSASGQELAKTPISSVGADVVPPVAEPERPGSSLSGSSPSSSSVGIEHAASSNPSLSSSISYAVATSSQPQSAASASGTSKTKKVKKGHAASASSSASGSLQLPINDLGMGFANAAKQNNLNEINRLWEQAGNDEARNAMFAYADYAAFRWAAYKGNIDVAARLRELAGDDVTRAKMLRSQNYLAFVWAAGEGQKDMLCSLFAYFNTDQMIKTVSGIIGSARSVPKYIKDWVAKYNDEQSEFRKGVESARSRMANLSASLTAPASVMQTASSASEDAASSSSSVTEPASVAQTASSSSAGASPSPSSGASTVASKSETASASAPATANVVIFHPPSFPPRVTSAPSSSSVTEPAGVATQERSASDPAVALASSALSLESSNKAANFGPMPGLPNRNRSWTAKFCSCLHVLYAWWLRYTLKY